MDQNQKELFLALGEIKGDLKSVLVMQAEQARKTDGLADTVSAIDKRVTVLERWPSKIAGAVAVGSVVLFLYGDRIAAVLEKIGL